MRPTPRSLRPRLPRRRERKAAGETLVAAVIVEVEADAQAAIVEIVAEAVAVVEVTAVVAGAAGTVGVASGAVASGLRTGRDRPWVPAQARSRAR